MKNLKNLRLILSMLAAVLSAQGAFAQSAQPLTSSAKSSPTSDTRVNKDVSVTSSGVKDDEAVTRERVTFTRACAAAVDDLIATRSLVTALEDENAALKTRLNTEKQTNALLTELNATRKSETKALQDTVTAKSEAVAAKDAVIASQDKLIETLRKKKTSPLRRLTDVLIGAAMMAILK